MGFVRSAAVFGLLGVCVCAQTPARWRLTRSDHFELYSQASDANARSSLIWLEQLRGFYLQKTGLTQESLPAVRVIGFRTARDYEPYRLDAASDAHYIGTETRDYIVMTAADAGQFGIAAHEYAHSFLRAAGLRFPPWFSEGLAEFFSTVNIGAKGCTIGGDIPGRSQTLERQRWMPIAELVGLPADSSVRGNRDTAAVFYAESWALADMLVLSPEYGPRFGALIAALAAGTPGAQALPSVYGKSLDQISRDLHGWMAAKRAPAALPGIEVGDAAVGASEDVSQLQARAMLADMLLAAGELDRAAAMYKDLSREMPADASVSAALGTIALRTDDKESARREWKHAIDQGIADAKLCYEFAALGEMAGLPAEELRPALERAISLKPNFDDARYHLALVEKNSGDFEAALVNFRAMGAVAPARAYSYWIAVTDTLIQLDRRDEALSASKHALEHAANATDRRYAAQLGYIAKTDVAVQFTTNKDGRMELETTRVPHQTHDWNPFIEPGDKIRHVEGALREIDCSGSSTKFVVDTGAGTVTLTIADPGHVQMRNAPSEFTCGVQQAAKVAVDYAVSANPGAKTDGLVRGVEFK